MKDSIDIISILEEHSEEIKGFGIKSIGIFGSFARNEADKGSDIDILIEFEPEKKSFDNYMDLKFFLEGLFGIEADLVISSAVKPDLRSEILESVQYAKV